MWKQLKISDKTYFVFCNFKSTQDVTFMLYDQKMTWSQTLLLQEVKQKVKLLNKRFDFSEDNIKEALANNVVHSATIEEEATSGLKVPASCLLKIKYRVKNCFLNFEWTLKKHTLEEFQQTFVQPLLQALLGCHQQVELLTDSIRKKDMELKQFRIEGVELNRKTLITKPFDVENFTKMYKDVNTIAINFKELAKYVKERNSENEPEITNKNVDVNKIETITKCKENVRNEQDANTKLSPKQHKKRKAVELKMQYLEENLKLRKIGLKYDSSQSQTTGSGNSQIIEEAEIKKLEQKSQTPKDQQTVSKSENNILPRKSSRISPINQNQSNLCSEDRTDSDTEDIFRKLRERKTIKVLANMPKVSGTTAKKGETPISHINNSQENRRKCVKSPNPSNTTRSKSPVKISDGSSVFDFSTESEDDIPTLNKQKKCKEAKTLLTKTNPKPANKVSEELNISSPAAEYSPHLSVISMRPSLDSINLSQSPVAINEISNQLDIIRKELESLEAMRLADLKQRTCG